MGKAFTSHKKEKPAFIKILIPVILFVMIVVIVIIGVGNVQSSAGEERLRAMEQAVRRSIVQCYAIEGRYPANLEYLRDNYGLILDYDNYVYHYQRVAANLLPQVAVFEAS